MAKSAVIDAIRSQMPPSRALSWEYRVPPKHAATLKEIKEAYHAGSFGPRKITAARAIAKYLTDHGIASIGPQGVLQWLAKN